MEVQQEFRWGIVKLGIPILPTDKVPGADAFDVYRDVEGAFVLCL